MPRNNSIYGSSRECIKQIEFKEIIMSESASGLQCKVGSQPVISVSGTDKIIRATLKEEH